MPGYFFDLQRVHPMLCITRDTIHFSILEYTIAEKRKASYIYSTKVVHKKFPVAYENLSKVHHTTENLQNLWRGQTAVGTEPENVCLLNLVLDVNFPYKVITWKFLVSGQSFLLNNSDFGDIKKRAKCHPNIIYSLRLV